MKGIYLGSYKAQHNIPGLIYQDINGLRDIPGDMLTINLSEYDYIIATPPCNWWSRANYRRETSEYSIRTKLLLPCILYKLTLLKKPFIVENVRSFKKFTEYELDKIPGIKMYKIGRHTYWSNIKFRYDDLLKSETQKAKTEIRNGKKIWLSSQNIASKDRQGTNEVHEVIDRFINTIMNNIISYIMSSSGSL